MIGHVGTAGPERVLASAQVHVEFFSNSELFENCPELAVGSRRRHRRRPVLRRAARSTTSSTPTRTACCRARSCRAFYCGRRRRRRCATSSRSTSPSGRPSRAGPRRCACRRTSRSIKPAEIDAMVAEQITPGLWWDAAVAKHCRAAARRRRLSLQPGQLRRLVQPAAARRRGARDRLRREQVERRASDVPQGHHRRLGDDRTARRCGRRRRRRGPVQQEADARRSSSAGFDAPECGRNEAREARRRRTWRPPTRRAFVGMLGAAAPRCARGRANARPTREGPRSAAVRPDPLDRPLLSVLAIS